MPLLNEQVHVLLQRMESAIDDASDAISDAEGALEAVQSSCGALCDTVQGLPSIGDMHKVRGLIEAVYNALVFGQPSLEVSSNPTKGELVRIVTILRNIFINVD